jgi:hypothetical protein
LSKVRHNLKKVISLFKLATSSVSYFRATTYILKAGRPVNSNVANGHFNGKTLVKYRANGDGSSAGKAVQEALQNLEPEPLDATSKSKIADCLFRKRPIELPVRS